MPDEAKPTQNTNNKDTQANRPKQNRGNYKGRNNRQNNRPSNRPANKVAEPKKNHFEIEAALHTAKADYWRKRVNGFSAFTLVYAALGLSFGFELSGVQPIASLGLIGFTLIFLIMHAAGNFRTHKRNAVINTHRHNMLMTAEEMAKTTKDPVTKEELMLEALASIGGSDKD